jgi:glycosyltransferase involved in cell wall biosynthesis
MNRIPVLFCTDGIFPHAVGGMQRHSKLLVEALAETGEADITVVHPHPGVQIFANHNRITEVAIKSEPTSGTYLIDCYRYSKQVAEIVRQHPGSIIYSQGLSVWSEINRFGKRVIVNPHGLEPYQGLTFKDNMRGFPFRMIFNYLFSNAGRVVSLGGRLTGILQKHAGHGKVAILPNAVNIPALVPRQFNNKPLKFLFVGRFAFNKGIDVLINAAEQLHKDGLTDAFEFHLVGKGPLWDHYSQHRKLPNLKYLGFADDEKLNELYRTCDVFVLPTLFEGMPTVVLEAMAHGMPIMVTDVGATLEMVGPENGFITEKKSVSSLLNAIHAYHKLDVTQRKKLSEASFQKVSELFTWKKVAARHLELFREMQLRLN